MNIHIKYLAWILILTLFSSFAFSQHNNRAARNLHFRFGNPGARALGIGGAFTGMADDASAVIANPAGLTQIHSASFSVETSFNQTDYEVPFYGGSIYQENLFDFDFQFESKSFSESRFHIPFVSYVKPVNRFRFGFFYHLQADVNRDYTTDTIRVFPLEQLVDQIRYFPSHDVVDVMMQDVGFSVARQFGNALSLGVSLYYSQMEYAVNSTILAENSIGGALPIDQLAESDDSGVGGVLGLFYTPNSWLSVGVSYKFQPEFDYHLILDQSIEQWQANFEKDSFFKVPDALSFGLSYRVTDFFLVMFDVQRVYYSQISDEFIDFNGIPNVSQTIEDGTELHVGLEKIIPDGWGGKSWTLRAGYWLEPYHAPINTIDDQQLLEGDYSSGNNLNIRDSFFLHLFERDVDHYNLGLGFGWSKALHFDFAVDLSRETTQISFSTVYRPSR